MSVDLVDIRSAICRWRVTISSVRLLTRLGSTIRTLTISPLFGFVLVDFDTPWGQVTTQLDGWRKPSLADAAVVAKEEHKSCFTSFILCQFDHRQMGTSGSFYWQFSLQLALVGSCQLSWNGRKADAIKASAAECN